MALKLISTTDSIQIAAQKEVLLTSGQAYVRISNGNIDIHALGTIDSKAANHPFAGPASLNYTLPGLQQ